MVFLFVNEALFGKMRGPSRIFLILMHENSTWIQSIQLYAALLLLP